MRHVDDDALTLIALGEQQADGATAEHLAGCAQCRDELAALTAVVAAGRGGPLERPPARVWDRIAEQIAVPDGASTGPAGAEPAAGTAAAEPAPPPRPAVRRPGAIPASPRPAAATRPAGRRDKPRGRSGWSRVGLLAAGLAAGVAGTLVVTQWQDTPAQPTTVATAELEPLPDWDETGEARVEDAGDHLLLHVAVTGDVEDGLREVWLLDEEAEQLVSLGLLVGREGTFDLPVGLDLEKFVLVDVSREPIDGDPTHSGDSIVRGRLNT